MLFAACLFLILTPLIFAIEWVDGYEDALWAKNCDFKGDDIMQLPLQNFECGKFCWQNADCSHFTWYQNVCYLKSCNKDKSEATYLENAICGIAKPRVLFKNPDLFKERFSWEERKDFPKLIWAYWDNEMPQTVKEIIKSWKNYTVGYKINMVNHNNLNDFIQVQKPKNFDQLAPAQKCDWIRLTLLNKYGGIYLDSSVILTRDISWILQEMKRTDKKSFLYGYSPHQKIENWLIAAYPKEKFITKWLNELDMAIEYYGSNIPTYYQSLNFRYGREKFMYIMDNPGDGQYTTYFLAYVCAVKVREIDQQKSSLIIHAQDMKFGGYYYVRDFHYDAQKILDRYILPDKENLQVSAVIKLIKGTRELLESHLMNQGYIHPNSIYETFVRNNQ